MYHLSIHIQYHLQTLIKVCSGQVIESSLVSRIHSAISSLAIKYLFILLLNIFNCIGFFNNGTKSVLETATRNQQKFLALV